MAIKQISIFLENKPGRLAKVTETLGEAGINIRALSVAELGEFGVIRLIVDDPDNADRVLREQFTVGITDVLAIEMGDEPGSLAKIVKTLGDKNLNIEYAYAFVAESRKKAVLVVRVDDIKKAENLLKWAGIRLVKADELYKM